MRNHDQDPTSSRRNFLKSGSAIAASAAAIASTTISGQASADTSEYADPKEPALPPSDMTLDLERSALVVIDPFV